MRINEAKSRDRGLHRVLLAAWSCAVILPQFLDLDAEAQPIVLNGSSNAPTAGLYSKKRTQRIGHDLLSLHNEYEAYLNQIRTQRAPVPSFSSGNTLAPVMDDFVVIDFAAADNPDTLASDLRTLGATNISIYGQMVSARLSITAIPALDKLSSLQYGRMAYPMTQAGSVTSQGDAAVLADIARQSFGVDGAGVTVGTLSDSYDCLNGAESGLASGDLPAKIVVLEEGPCANGTDEGRAMMELVHDIAPGSTQIFHTAVLGQANFAQGILDLAGAGADVICDDIGYFNEPFFQDGIIAQAIDTVNNSGVAYFSAAGNMGRDSYESAFRPSGMSVDIGFGPSEAHDFDPGPDVDTCQSVTIPAGSELVLAFQWDQPYFSVSGPPGSASDIDIVITDQTCEDVVARGDVNNIGNDPIEVMQFTNSSRTGSFNLMILRFSGPSPGLMKTIISNRKGQPITINEFSPGSSTSFGHSAPPQGLGVGAASYTQTPRFGIDPPRIQNSSSAGGTPILFDLAGNRLPQALIRRQPGIVAPDGVDNTILGTADFDGTGFPNFFGTSAAVPHAAAVAALIKNLDVLLTPLQIYTAMQSTAIDMDDPNTPGFDTGFDAVSGFGLIQADAALASIMPSSILLQISRGGWRAVLQ